MTATIQSFAYRGRNTAGKLVKGKVDAPSESSVAARLRGMGIAPLAIEEAKPGTGINREINLKFLEKRVGLKDLAVMSRQMATMIASGLALLRTLRILAEQTENKKLAATLDAVRADVEAGRSLSDALAKHPDDFPPLMISLVRGGETGGFLEQALESVAENYEKEVKLRATIKSALTYPVAVLGMAVLAVIGMLIFIVPVFQGMFEGLGGELPLPTQFLVWLSGLMIWLGPLLLVAAVAFSFWWRANRNSPDVRKVWEPALLKLPVFGSLFRKVAIARFSRNFSTMLASGVPILQALSVVGDTSGNWVVEQALMKVQESVRKGNSVAAPLAQEPVFPPMVTQMVAVGEDSGTLEQMLAKVADFYDDEVLSTTEQLTALIEPIMIAFIGVVIGGMIVALYMPVFSIFQQVQ
ncbi:type II secretion system F family protein [Lysobacter korlensis]|uniref:Type II secretion system F family protein n=1 Tax=Lysobacter korlensis TaxID=553636 RepID=A0ABV6RUR2_9GAMM